MVIAATHATTAGAQDSSKQSLKTLPTDVRQLLATHGDGIEASVWLGGTNATWFELNSSVARPTASAIKSFYLVELFARFHDQLDEPLPGAADVLADDSHPAISHFDATTRKSIRRDLGGQSARRVAEIMMGKVNVPNATYNAAANVVTAVLGGPEKLTAAIRAHDPDFKDVSVRRYMLRDRKVQGDNEATAASLAALYQKLARRKLTGIDDGTMDAIRAVLFRKRDANDGSLFNKGGDLMSDPITVVHAGWWETKAEPIIYVVMTMQPSPGAKDRKSAFDALSHTATELDRRIVAAGRTHRPSL